MTGVAAVAFRDVDIVFGGRPQAALPLIDAGRTRDEILAETGQVVGVAGATLAIEQGEICVRMGLSGSGKSTLLRAVNRLARVARGAVLVEDEGREVDVTRCDAATLRRLRMRRIAMVFQQFALLPWRTVAENVAFGLELRGVPRRERERIVKEKLELVHLDAWAGKHAHELSGGMQQRVGLARAFATDADILLMDEPFSALDPLIRDKLQDELLELQARLRKTIVFVSHDLDEAVKLGNQIAIMEHGRVIQAGTAEDILLRPADAYVAAFVRHMNPLNVLRGHAVMTPASALRRQDGQVLVDDAGHLRVTVDGDDRPTRAFVQGRETRLAACDGDSGGRVDGEVLVAPADLRLRSAIELKRQTPHPILLVDQLGRLAGLCGDEEIYRGLLRRQAA
jgi:glycine betaine/proline transport system ATP-binding protein